MTVKELILELQQHPQDMDVYFRSTSDFEYEMVNISYQETINFKETPRGVTMAEEKVVVLDEKY